MKITITRSFSATKQLKQFEPIKSECTVSAEVEVNDLQDRYIDGASSLLDDICRAEVKKTLEEITANASRKPDKAKIKDVSQQEVIEDIELPE